jgi:hypothetical protein
MTIRSARPFTVAFAALSLLTMAATAATAQDAPNPDVDKLKTQLVAMGFKPTVKGSTVTIDAAGNPVNFTISDDKSNLYAFISYSVTPEQAAKAPLLNLLVKNDSSASYFALHTQDGKIDQISLNQRTEMEGINAVRLRAVVDLLSQGASDDIFNPTTWK